LGSLGEITLKHRYKERYGSERISHLVREGGRLKRAIGGSADPRSPARALALRSGDRMAPVCCNACDTPTIIDDPVSMKT
jgi:hypothetical protein